MGGQVTIIIFIIIIIINIIILLLFETFSHWLTPMVFQWSLNDNKSP